MHDMLNNIMNASGNLLDALRVDIPQEWTAKVEY
ncbi:Agglutination protein [Vibrio cholerae]|nr:Agglutination protein [Vibrio cholerae]